MGGLFNATRVSRVPIASLLVVALLLVSVLAEENAELLTESSSSSSSSSSSPSPPPSSSSSSSSSSSAAHEALGTGPDSVLGFSGDDLNGATDNLLQYLLHPLPVQEFLDLYWDHSPFVIHRCKHVDKATGKRIALDGKSFAPEFDTGEDDMEQQKQSSQQSSQARSDTEDDHERAKYTAAHATPHSAETPEPKCSDTHPLNPDATVFDYYADLLTSEDLEFPLWQNSDEPISDRRRAQKDAGKGTTEQFKDLHAAFANGHPVIVDLSSHYVRKAHRLMSYIEQFLSVITRGQAVITPKGKRFFDPHFDFENNFILQIEGSSLWRIYDHRVPFPVLQRGSQTQNRFKRSELGAPQFEVILNPGDFLYIPRGWIYEAGTLGANYSFLMQVAISVDQYTWTQVLHSLVHIGKERETKCLLATMLESGQLDMVNEQMLHSLVNQAAKSDARFRLHFLSGLCGGRCSLFSPQNYHTFQSLLRTVAVSPSFDESPIGIRDSLFKALKAIWTMYSVETPSSWEELFDVSSGQPLALDREAIEASLQSLHLDFPPVVVPPAVYPSPFNLDVEDLVARHAKATQELRSRLEREMKQAFDFQAIVHERQAIQTAKVRLEREEQRRKSTNLPPLTPEERQAFGKTGPLPELPEPPLPIDWYRWRLTRISYNRLSHPTVVFAAPPALSYLPPPVSPEWNVYVNTLANMYLTLAVEHKDQPVASFDQLDALKEIGIHSKLRGIPQPSGMLHVLFERGTISAKLADMLAQARDATHPDVRSILYPVTLDEQYPYCVLLHRGYAVPVPYRFVAAFQFVLARTSVSSDHLKFEQRKKHQELKEQLIEMNVSVDGLEDIDLREAALRTFQVSEIPYNENIVANEDSQQQKILVAKIAVYLGFAEVVAVKGSRASGV